MTIEAAAKLLVASVQRDVSDHGGLVSRETIRACDELRMVLSRAKK